MSPTLSVSFKSHERITPAINLPHARAESTHAIRKRHYNRTWSLVCVCVCCECESAIERCVIRWCRAYRWWQKTNAQRDTINIPFALCVSFIVEHSDRHSKSILCTLHQGVHQPKAVCDLRDIPQQYNRAKRKMCAPFHAAPCEDARQRTNERTTTKMECMGYT